MNVTSRRSLAAICALALVASACRSEVSIEQSESIEPIETVEPQPTPPASNPVPTVPAAPPAPSPQAASEPGQTFQGEPPAAFETPAQWASPLPLDNEVIDGSLTNGMRYLIRRNGRPGSQAQLRLVVHAGSLNEAPGSEGAAHFLEHMMFNGTERFPGNEIVPVLESFGSGFGPDVNAYTSFEETVYELQVPTRSADTLQLGFDVLHQWATAATITPEAVAAERGVVREEHRQSTEPLSGRIGTEVRDVLLAGTPYLRQEPIGSAAVIETMSDSQLKAFYQAWYKPELMTVVAVGDFDPGDVERRIIATFDQPQSVERATPVDTGPAGPLAEPVFDVVIDREIERAEVEVLWRRANRPAITQDDRRLSLVESLAMSLVNTRLFERLQTKETVLLTSNAGIGGYTSTTQIVTLAGRAAADQIDLALVELLSEMEQARQHGFSEAEFDRVLQVAQAGIEQSFSQRDTRQDSEFAYALVEYSLGRDILLDATARRDIALDMLTTVSLDDVQRFLFEVLDSPPYVLVTAPTTDQATVPQPEALAGVYDQVVGVATSERVTTRTEQSELMARPEPAEIVDEQTLNGLNATVVTFENGARLAYRQTRITENIVQFGATSRGGFFAVEGPEVPLLSSVSSLAAGSGYESLDAVTLDQLLTGSIASLATWIGRSEEGLNGEASTDDLEVLFQLAHLSMTEPTITDLSLRQFDESRRPLAENPDLRPSLAADMELWRLRYGDSPWFRRFPTVADLDAFDKDASLAAYKERFASAGDFVFVVVGDFDPADVVDLAARYLGTLPDDGVREAAIDRDPGLPEENRVATVRSGVGDQGLVRINWESPYAFTLDAAVTAQALELVVNARLRDLIREELGAAYSPRAAVSVLSEPKSWIDTTIEVEADPDRIDEVSTAVRDELERIRSGDFDEQYLALAVDQMTEDYRFFSNEDWFQFITFHVLNPDRPDNEYQLRTDLALGLTVADIAAAAQTVFPKSRSVEIRLLPAG